VWQCFDAKSSPAIKPQVRRPGIDMRACREDTDGPAGNGVAGGDITRGAAHGLMVASPPQCAYGGEANVAIG
jgi:hypothetical protein